MFFEVLRFECRYQLRSPLFIVVALVFFFLAFLAMASENITVGGGTDNLDLNSTYAVIQTHYVLSILLMFAAVAFVATPVTRDREQRTEEILVATGVSPSAFFAGRFAGGFLFSALVGCAAVLGTLAGTFMPWLDAERIQPFVAEPYLFSIWAVTLPTLFVVASIVAAVAAMTRSLMASYVTLVALLVGWIVARANTDHETIAITALLDPFGVIPFTEVTRYWTAFEKNGSVPALAGSLLYNRLIWITVAIVALGTGALRFGFAPGRRGRRRAPAPAAVPTPVTSNLFGRVSPQFGARSTAVQFLSQVRMELGGVMRTYPFYVLLFFAVMNVVFMFYGAVNQLYGTAVLPVTRMMLQMIEGGYLFMAVVIVVYYAGELVHRERQSRVAEYVDAMPFPNGVVIGAKLAALVIIVALVLLVGMLAAIVVQLLHGYTRLELPVYLFGLFVVQGSFPFLLCVVAIAVQCLVSNKFVGMLAVVLAFFGFGALDNLGFEHVLYQLGVPSAPLSDMNGWGHFVEPVLTVGAYWASIMVLFAVLAHLLMRRGSVGTWRQRFRDAGARFTGPVRAVSALALLTAVGLGSWIFYNTNVLNTYRTADDEERLTAEYEKRYKQFEDLPMPEAVAIEADVAIYPSERRVESRGRAVLENVFPEPIEEIHVTLPRVLRLNTLTIEGAELVEEDRELGYLRFRPAQPMAPGGQLQAAWDLSWLNPGFVHARSTTRVVENGTFVDSTEIFPSFGYARGSELTDNNRRRKHGLPPAERLPKYDEAGAFAPSQTSVRKRTAFKTRVSTAADQIAVAPGYLTREWSEDGRRYFEYEMDAPIWPFASFTSARYAVERGTWNDVAIEVYYHPPHRYNVERMIEATRTSLDYFTREFSPYQYRQFRILEFPAYARFAQAFPNTIPYSEAIGFVADLSDPNDIDYVFYVTAHELAHQWWGHQVMGRYAQGMTLLVETLAQYSALMVMEHAYGPDKMRRFLRYELDNYLANRGGEQIEEQPLRLVENQGYVHYRKGSLAMYALKDAIGESAVNRALRAFLERFAFKEAPFPLSGDLIDEFRAVAGPEHQALITDLFEKIVLWDLAVVDARAEPLSDGRFRVSMEIEARKLEADGEGREVVVPLDEELDVGIYPAAPEDLGENDLPTPLLFERTAIRSGTNRLEFVVAERPQRVGIDPISKRIDRNPDDNLRTLE